MVDMRRMAAAEAVRRVMNRGATYWEIADAALAAADRVERSRPIPRTSDMNHIVEAIRAGGA